MGNHIFVNFSTNTCHLGCKHVYNAPMPTKTRHRVSGSAVTTEGSLTVRLLRFATKTTAGAHSRRERVIEAAAPRTRSCQTSGALRWAQQLTGTALIVISKARASRAAGTLRGICRQGPSAEGRYQSLAGQCFGIQPRNTDALCTADSPRHRIRSHAASAVHAQTVSEPCNQHPVRRDAYPSAMANMHRGRLCTVAGPAKNLHQRSVPAMRRGHHIRSSTEGRATKRTAGRPADRACKPPIGFRNAQRFGSWNQAQPPDVMAKPIPQ